MTKTVALNEKLLILEDKLVNEFISNMDNGEYAAVEDLVETLNTYLGEEPFYILTMLFQKVLTRAALLLNRGEVAGSARWLGMNRTTLQERTKRLGIREPMAQDAEKYSRHLNRNLGISYPRKCRLCLEIFAGDYKTPCPRCKNSDRKMIKIYIPK